MMSYWIYQHLGNLSPARARRRRALPAGARQRRATAASSRASPPRSTTTGAGTRWSFCRDLGNTRAIFIDSRAGRVLEPERRADRRRRRVGLARRARERRLRPPADRDDDPLPALAGLPPPRGLERAGLRRRLGRRSRRAGASSCAAPSTSTTGPPSRSSFQRLRGTARGGRHRASAASRRPRSSSSPATSTTPTWPRPASGPAPGCRAPSTRPSARPTATRSTTTSGA